MYSVSTPDSFVGQGEPDAGDGQVFKGPDGARLTVFGSWNATDTNLAREMSDEVGGIAGAHPVVTGGFQNPAEAVRTGTAGPSRFTVRILARADEFIVMSLVYPASSRSITDGLIARIAASFHFVDGR